MKEKHIFELHSAAQFDPIELDKPTIDIEKRVALLEQEWTLSFEYIKSQYQRSPKELIEVMLNNEQEASLKYCIFMVPRSGSTLLTELLAGTRKLGFPGESFVPDVIRTLSLAFSDVFSSYENFLVTRHRSENGVYGIEIESERLMQEPEFFADVKSWRHIYIWREDVLAQAISYQISIETNVWHNFSGSPQDEKFHYISRHAIVEKINFLLGVERFFENFFKEQEISPYKLSYEELVREPFEHTRRIAAHIGVDTSDSEIVDEGKVVLQPTAKGRNAYYKALVIGGGGDFWGYDIHETNGQYMAVLRGVDLSLLDTAVPRAPLLFLSASREELCATVQHYVMKHMSSLPPVADKI
jgi:LPS sulfotransferase NodH